jgi:hypothetical protein
MLLGQPRLESLSGSRGVVSAKDEVVQLGGAAISPMSEVVPVNP